MLMYNIIFIRRIHVCIHTLTRAHTLIYIIITLCLCVLFDFLHTESSVQTMQLWGQNWKLWGRKAKAEQKSCSKSQIEVLETGSVYCTIIFGLCNAHVAPNSLYVRSFLRVHINIVHQSINFHFAMYVFRMPNIMHSSSCDIVARHGNVGCKMFKIATCCHGNNSAFTELSSPWHLVRNLNFCFNSSIMVMFWVFS